MESFPPPSLVWFKRDLRAEDHEPLARAAALGPVVPVFVYEPELLHTPVFDGAHLTYLNAALTDLSDALAQLGAPLVIRRGEAVAALETLRRETGATRLFAHEETGDALTYARDRRVRRWARETGVEMTELPGAGVIRRLKSRDGWSREWNRRMARPPIPAPARLVPVSPLPASCGVLGHAALGVPACAKSIAPPGRAAALGRLHDFLNARSPHYSRGMSSPLAAPDACSRLSADLAFGVIGLRETMAAVSARRDQLRGMPDAAFDAPEPRPALAALLDRLRPRPGAPPAPDPRADLFSAAAGNALAAAPRAGPSRRDHLSGLKSFEARLHWHCHFMQKLEDEPALEHRNLHRACDGLREAHWNDDLFQAWREGRTGYPLVDACMREVAATGWMTFRMRAMVASFAAYHLWLHWPRPAEHLARCFVDYEAGIHFSQFQMQSGTTGINTVRIYSPLKQARDHDPDGDHIRRWVPELAGLPGALVHEPWLLGAARLAKAGASAYPAPVVDHATAVARAHAAFAALRSAPAARAQARRVVEKHGSRKGTAGFIQDPVRRTLAPRATDHDSSSADLFHVPEPVRGQPPPA